MQEEAIRAFRKTWKPKEPQREGRVSRPSLAHGPKVQQVSPRPSLAHPLPPPAPEALCARAETLPEGPPTGVRRRPVREDEEREALLRVAKERRVLSTPSAHRAPPPLSPSTQAMLLKLERNAKVRKANKPSCASELTDSSVRILPSYSVPPPPALDESRDAFVPVQADWLDVVDESVPLELSVRKDAPSPKRKRKASPARRVLRYALVGGVFCATLVWNIPEAQLRDRARSWTHTTVSALSETWARLVDAKPASAARTFRAADASTATLLWCEEPMSGVDVLSMMSEALEEPALMQSVMNDEAQLLMSGAGDEGFSEPMLTSASDELASAGEELAPSVKRHRRHRRSHDAAIKRRVRAEAAP